MPRNSPPLVSVMITTRNRLALLARALESVSRQDYSKLEILIMDDASEDGTSDHIRSHYPDIRLFEFETNRGLVVARNLLMGEANGKYIVSLDDDAYFLNKNAISNVVKRMEYEPEIAVVTFRILQANHEETSTTDAQRYTNLFLGGAHCIRKEILPGMEGYREFFFHQGEEADLALRLLDKGNRILYFPGATVVHESSGVARDFRRMAVYGPRNLLLRSWINEPFPWWILSTGNAIAKYLAKGFRDGSLLDVLKGFWVALQDWPRVKSSRRPVSSKAMLVYVALRRSTITSVLEVQRLYEAPPSFFRVWSRKQMSSLRG